MQVFLTARDLLSVCDMALKLITMDGVTRVTIIDCQSTYGPLLARYNDLPADIGLLLVQNLGPRAAWSVMAECMTEPYVVSDGDLDISEFPQDALVRMRERLISRPYLLKVGASLKLSDLPDTPQANQARQHEAQFWQCPTDPGFYAADIDTTLAVYRYATWGGYGPSERCEFATARHLLWYYTPDQLPPDVAHYCKHLDPRAGACWSTAIHHQMGHT